MIPRKCSFAAFFDGNCTEDFGFVAGIAFPEWMAIAQYADGKCKKKYECVFSALEASMPALVCLRGHDKWRVFYEEARSSGCGACSPERHCQCPGVECPDGQRQGATAAARSDEGVTLRPRLYREGAGFAPALTV
jgi:hypothetical protein